MKKEDRHQLNNEYIKGLYVKYFKEIVALRQKALSVGYLNKLGTQMHDEEAEQTYMLVRETKPETVVEMSPCRGGSSFWLISGLIKNEKGFCHSYDVIPDSEDNLPQEFRDHRKFYLGDAQEQPVPDNIDYLFMDSDHREPFTQWYIKEVFPKTTEACLTSVHDMILGKNYLVPEEMDNKGPSGEWVALEQYFKSEASEKVLSGAHGYYSSHSKWRGHDNIDNVQKSISEFRKNLFLDNNEVLYYLSDYQATRENESSMILFWNH